MEPTIGGGIGALDIASLMPSDVPTASSNAQFMQGFNAGAPSMDQASQQQQKQGGGSAKGLKQLSSFLSAMQQFGGPTNVDFGNQTASQIIGQIGMPSYRPAFNMQG